MHLLLKSLPLIALVGAAQPAISGTLLSKEDGIQLAEKFIAEQGYTQAPPHVKRFHYESLRHPFITLHEELQLRRNQLEPRAYGAVGRAKSGWLVVFRYSEQWRSRYRTIDEHNVGRVVKVDVGGKKLVLMHKDIFLKYIDKKPLPTEYWNRCA